MAKKILTAVEQEARELFSRSFLFSDLEAMRDAVANARDKEVNRYKKAQKETGVDYATRSKTYASCPSLLIMIDYPSGADRLDCNDPTWLKSVSAISKIELIRHIETVLESRQRADALKYGFTIAVDSQIYYYENANDRLQGIPAEPTGEYYSLDLVKYQVAKPEISNTKEIMEQAEQSEAQGTVTVELTNNQRLTIGDIVRQSIEWYRELLKIEKSEYWQYLYVGQLTHKRNILKSLNTI